MSGPYGAAAAFAGVDACIDPRADAGIRPCNGANKKAAPYQGGGCFNLTYSLSYNIAGTAAGTDPWHP